MSSVINANDILEFSVHIEQNGFKFYLENMKKFSDERLQKLFQFMADEEFKHEDTFRRLMSNLGDYYPHESYPGEYEVYMKEFLKTHALANDEALKAKLDSIKTIDDAVEIALDFEKDSIVLFSMLKRYVDDKNKAIVEKIIQEEFTHISKIIEFRMGK